MEVRKFYSLRFIPASRHKYGTYTMCSHSLLQKFRLLAALDNLNKASWNSARRRWKNLQSWTSTKFHVSYMVLTTKQFFIQWCVWLKLNLLVTFPKLESFPVIFESPSKPTILATILENVSLKKQNAQSVLLQEIAHQMIHISERLDFEGILQSSSESFQEKQKMFDFLPWKFFETSCHILIATDRKPWS